MSLKLALALVCTLAMLGCGGGSDHAQLRIMQASPNLSTVNVLVDSKTVSSNIAFSQTTGYLSVASGSRHLQVEVSGTSTPILDQTLTFSSGTSTTYLAANYASSITGVQYTDDNSAPDPGKFRVRIINASPGLGNADIYIVPSGTNLSTVTPNFSSLAFLASSTYLSVNAGAYEVFFTLPGSKFAYIDSGPITFSAGQVRTVVSLDGASGGFTSVTLRDLN
ncbi:MAG TPA: DUF4397 domain-containing protein [Terriglobales bacterium]|nr:DUF4397 domain-containing protein [Terriglobales bacterium]